MLERDIKNSFWIKVVFTLQIIGLCVLLFLTAFNKSPSTFDEVLFPPNVELLKTYGFTTQFLLEMEDQAPGPLYQFVHILFEPFTNLRPPGIRIVNFLFLIGMIIILYKTIGKYNPDHNFKIIAALNILLIPMIWQVSGLALTELPTLFFATLTVFGLLKIKNSEKFYFILLWGIVSGLCLGLTILGRSPFLVMVVPLAIIIALVKNRKVQVAYISALVIALAMNLQVFLIWKGLMPPKQIHTGAGGIDIWHGILGFSYLSLVFLLVMPSWFYFRRQQIISYIALTVGFFIINYYLLKFEYSPLSVTLGKFLPQYILNYYPYIVAPFFGSLIICFLISTYKQVLNNRNDLYFLFLTTVILLIVLSTFKITHLFSSRYVVQVAPFIFILASRYDTQTPSKVIRILLGFGLGIASLLTYANFEV